MLIGSESVRDFVYRVVQLESKAETDIHYNKLNVSDPLIVRRLIVKLVPSP